MPLVKLTAKPDTWFKEGTEVFYEDECYAERRLTLQEYENMLSEYPYAIFFGTRIIENPASEGGGEIGEERIDGEVCLLEEFNVEIIPDTHN